MWGSHAEADVSVPTKGAQSSHIVRGMRRTLDIEQPLDPVSRRLLQLAGLLSLLLVALLIYAFLASDGPVKGSEDLSPLATAVDQVEETSGGRVSLYIVYSSPAIPRPIRASGGGAYNEMTDRSRLTFEMGNPLGGAPVRVVQLTDGDIEYTAGGLIESQLPPGKKWVRTDGADAGEEDETPLSMDDSLDLLDSSGQLRMVGRESVNGKMTRHYRGEIHLGELVDFLRKEGKATEAAAYERIRGRTPTQISAEGWVDRKNLLRRLRMVMPAPLEPGEPPVTVDMRMDFFDYGAQPDIQIPDPDSVVEGPLDNDEAATRASIS
jgi:hypothetical protein